jgi:outer membrane protein OmpA-like peptidoglycan-associated protein
MKKFAFAFMLLVIPAVFTIAQTDTVYFDDFDNNLNDWLINDTEYNYSDVMGGDFVLTRKVKGNMWRMQFVFFDRSAGFSIEAHFKVEKAGEYGIMWGMDDDDNNLNFTIQKKKFGVFRYIAGDYLITKEYTASDAIKEDQNTLKIVCENNKVIYLINDSPVFEESFPKMPGRWFGFTLWDQTKVKVDYLLILGKKQPINLIPDLIYASEPENLGPAVNSQYTELAPVISPDGSTLYFCRFYSPDNAGGEEDYSDIYRSEFADQKWAPAMNPGLPLNNVDANAVCSVSPDGIFLLLVNNYDESTAPLSGTVRTTGMNWSMPLSLQIENYYNHAEDQEFFLATDNRTLLMAIQRDDSHGKKDIYVSFWLDDLNFSEPVNLGPVVNTDEIDMSPFLASDGITLYYSSEGLPGYGSNDIYITRRLDDTWTNWSEPQNIGKPVNTSDWDAYYTIPASGEYAYYGSYENSLGEGDIFRIKLPENVRPKPVVLISGKVLNSKTLEPVEATILYETLPEGTASGMARSDAVTGEYKIVLPYGKNYGFSAGAPGFIPVSQNLDLLTVAGYLEITRDLFLVPVEAGETVRLNNIFFDFGKAILQPASYPELDRIAGLMTENQGMQIELSGHTDNVGSDDANLKLSDERAVAVKNYLIAKGIGADRMEAKGFGKSRPVTGNDTEEGRHLNRRVEFLILKV